MISENANSHSIDFDLIIWNDEMQKKIKGTVAMFWLLEMEQLSITIIHRAARETRIA